VHVRTRLAAGPALEKAACNLVADLHPGDAGTDLDHFAGPVGQRHQVFADRLTIAAADNAEVAIIQRTGDDFDQHLAMQRFWHRPIDFDETVDTGTTLGQ
jgi:hypothetical protein